VPTLTTLLAEIAGSRDPRGLLDSLGQVFAAFENQDSGCRSYGVADRDKRWFVKLAPDAATAAMLRSAARLHTAVAHPVILAPVAFTDLGERAGIVYPWVTGSVLYHPTNSHRPDRSDPSGPMHAFRAQPVSTIARVIDEIFDAHVAVAAAGFVAVDFYDGCMLYDPATATIRLIDLDHYRPGPYTVGTQPVPGSTRYLAPEERTPGATVDERTTVYTLARAGFILLDRGDTESAFRGTPAQHQVLARATSADPADRYASVAQFVAAWRAAQSAVRAG